ncbi:MAG: hypothetical protein OZ913_08340 [Ignavibacteriaceae bacterium]|nr:MAG: hypothetical protein EDM69_09655 [Chlorobiota bacterium]KXK03157.1 MAG: hypothetical protein UZ04_CHB001001554 [Chlorobi bacterium OLB4]MBV6399617.1 hypothetical protein [Ignavibacteria bacterium]MCC6886334.1 hypothetical protein [Ignavibacteriales bacterium]MCE7953773.1 hypothetical protein [Chlorobi bacterium CHB7]MDL1887707.1 hypothetical protein [Ignavibacteria bacterium CHB1]MEB2330294.1 hypothetical protein [Ignavibacteriaceae bacterium]OQY76820.1 MAG: hypothetical protein B6D4
MEQRIYKYNLDFYYKSLILYLVFLILYVLLKGSFGEEKFEVVFKDPLIYIVSIFIIFFLVLMVSAYIRRREIVIDQDRFLIRNRFGERVILFSDIVFMKFSRQLKERRYRGAVRLVKIKLRGRKRPLRIRLGEFENESRLYKEFTEINKQLQKEN